MTPTDWYAPNQQAVRADQSGPAEEGTGGKDAVPVREEEAAPVTAETEDLDELTKDELLELAKSRGISPANATMSKAELLEAVKGG